MACIIVIYQKRMVSRWALDQFSNTVWTFMMLLNWVKVYNAVCTPTPIHRLCTQTFSPPQKTNAFPGIEPAAPPPSWSPSWDVNPLHQSTTLLLTLLRSWELVLRSTASIQLIKSSGDYSACQTFHSPDSEKTNLGTRLPGIGTWGPHFTRSTGQKDDKTNRYSRIRRFREGPPTGSYLLPPEIKEYARTLTRFNCL